MLIANNRSQCQNRKSSRSARNNDGQREVTKIETNPITPTNDSSDKEDDCITQETRNGSNGEAAKVEAKAKTENANSSNVISKRITKAKEQAELLKQVKT